MNMFVSLSEISFPAPNSAGPLRRSLRIGSRRASFVMPALLLLVLAVVSPAHADSASPESKPRQKTLAPKVAEKSALDHSGHKRVGMASYYARRFSGRKMADGTPMRPESDNAASRTLPLGTMAQVTNLRDGTTAAVTIRDRGPYAKGRIIDLSPHTAKQLGMTKAGVVPVEVTPIAVPQPNGSVKSVVALSGSEKAGARRDDL